MVLQGSLVQVLRRLLRTGCTRDGIPARFGEARTSVERERRLPGLTVRLGDRYTVTFGLWTGRIGLPTVKTGHLSFNVGPMVVTLTVNTGLRTVTLPLRQTVPTPVKYALRMDRTGLMIGPPRNER